MLIIGLTDPQICLFSDVLMKQIKREYNKNVVGFN